MVDPRPPTLNHRRSISFHFRFILLNVSGFATGATLRAPWPGWKSGGRGNRHYRTMRGWVASSLLFWLYIFRSFLFLLSHYFHILYNNAAPMENGTNTHPVPYLFSSFPCICVGCGRERARVVCEGKGYERSGVATHARLMSGWGDELHRAAAGAAGDRGGLAVPKTALDET